MTFAIAALMLVAVLPTLLPTALAETSGFVQMHRFPGQGVKFWRADVDGWSCKDDGTGNPAVLNMWLSEPNPSITCEISDTLDHCTQTQVELYHATHATNPEVPSTLVADSQCDAGGPHAHIAVTLPPGAGSDDDTGDVAPSWTWTCKFTEDGLGTPAQVNGTDWWAGCHAFTSSPLPRVPPETPTLSTMAAVGLVGVLGALGVVLMRKRKA